MSKQDELRAFVEGDDRDGTPIFAGREREIEDLSSDLRMRLGKWRTDNEARDVCARFFEHFEIAGSTESKTRWTGEVVARCDGWPKHLHVELQALGSELLKTGLDVNALDQAGASAKARIAEGVGARRDIYYARRIGARSLEGRWPLAAEAATLVAGGLNDTPDLGRAIKRLAADRGAEDARLDLPEGMSGEGFVDAMIRAGILHKSADGTGFLSVPIPSFLNYLERKLGAGAPDAGAGGRPRQPGP